jgi:tetratricopeptide (TPR) repeat protein
MNRKINFRFLALLLVVVVVPGIGVHLLHGFQVKRQATVLLEQSRREEEGQQYDQAAEYLRRYLYHNLDDTEARIRYADLLLEKQRNPSWRARQQAYTQLEQVLIREPERHDLRRRVARLAMSWDIRAYSAAADHLQQLLKAFPEDGELYFLLGQCQEVTGNLPSAIESYSRAVKYDPKQVNAYARLAYLLRRELKQDARATQVLNEMVDNNKESWQAWRARARYRQQFDTNLDNALSDADRALNLAPEEPEVLLVAAEIFRDKGNLDEARKILQRGVEKRPDNPYLSQALANLELRTGSRSQALKVLEQGLANQPNDRTLLLGMADLLLQENRVDEARLVITKLRDLKIAPALLTYLDARLDLSDGKWIPATRAMENVRLQLNAWPNIARQADMLLGMCYQQLGDSDRQIAVYRRAMTANPDDAGALYQLAQALLQAGRLEEAAEEAGKLLRKDNAPPISWALAARIHVQQNLRLPAAQRKWEDSLKALDEADKRQPESLDLALLRAEVLLAQDQVPQAQQLLEKARDKYPDRIAAWAALISLAERTKGPEQALALIDQAQKRLGDTADMRLVRIRYWAKRRGAEADKALAELAQGLNRFGREDQLRLQSALAEAYFANGDLARAETFWEAVAKEQEENLRVRVLLFDVAHQAGKAERADQMLKEIRALEGSDGLFWRYCDVARLLDQVRRGDKSRVAQARTRLTEIAARRADWARVPLLEGELHELEGDQGKALDSYLRALELGEMQPRLVGRVLQLLHERKRYAEAEKLLRKAQERMELPAGVGRLAAETALQTGDRERALELARQTVSPKTKDFRELLWLTQFLTALKQHNEAEATLKRAIELGGDSPDAWIALVHFFVHTDQKDRAEAVLQEAQQKVPPDQAALTVAVGYEILGQTVLAEQQFRQAVAARPDDAATRRSAALFYLRREQFPNAEPHLRKLLTVKPAPAPEVVAFARRRLAIGLAGMGGYPRFQEALDLVEQNLRAGGGVEDQRAKARVLASRPNRMAEALALMESTRAQAAFQPEEMYILAQMYRVQRDWPKERQQMQNLLAIQGDNPLYVGFHVGELVQHGEKDEAQVWMAKLEKLQPRAFLTTSLKARLLHAQGKTDEAAAQLRNFALANGEASYVSVAAVLEQIGRVQAAEELFRRSAASPKHADTVLGLIAFLVRQKKLGEALDLLDKAWDTYRPEVVASVSLSLLQQASLSEQQWQRVQQRVEAALQKAPQNTTLLCCLALIQDFHRGRSAEAARIYRQVLERDPANVMALNNLAMLVSLSEGKYSEALALVGRAIEAAGPEPALLDTRGLVHITANRGDLAMKDLEAAIASGPTPYRYFHLAQARLAIKDRKVAQDAMARVRSLGGLEPQAVHPLERAAQRKLALELSGR